MPPIPLAEVMCPVENLSGRDDFRLFTTNAHASLAHAVSSALAIPLGRCDLGRFSNGEIRCQVRENVRRAECVILATGHGSPGYGGQSVNDALMEVLVLADALRRASAASVVLCLPCFPYARQDKKTAGREPITARLVADLLEAAGVSRVVTVDLHAASIQGFFRAPVDNLYALPLHVRQLTSEGWHGRQDACVAAPDAGGVARARLLSDRLELPLVLCHKRRSGPERIMSMEVVGDVAGRHVLLIDDMIGTGGTLLRATEELLARGAVSVQALCTHLLAGEQDLKRLADSQLARILCTDSVPVSTEEPLVRVLPLAGLLSEALRRNYLRLSVSELFE